MKFGTRIQKGFTLVELLIVIIIIAILAAVVVPKFTQSSTKSKEAALRSDLKLCRNAVELFRADCASYPASIAALSATSAPPTGKDSSGADVGIVATDWKGPYLESTPLDPTNGAAYSYSTTAGTVGKINSTNGDYSTW